MSDNRVNPDGSLDLWVTSELGSMTLHLTAEQLRLLKGAMEPADSLETFVLRGIDGSEWPLTTRKEAWKAGAEALRGRDPDTGVEFLAIPRAPRDGKPGPGDLVMVRDFEDDACWCGPRILGAVSLPLAYPFRDHLGDGWREARFLTEEELSRIRRV